MDSRGDREALLLNLNEKNYNPLNDVLFKFIFGKEERKQITIDFLNSVLLDYLHHEIKDLTFAPTEMSPEHEYDKLTRLDVACVLDSGEQVDVEVQVINQKNMQNRSLYYWAQMYVMSLPSGKTYRALKPVIAINILDFSLFKQVEPHTMFGVYNPQSGERLSTHLEMHFLEIPKFLSGPKKRIQEMTKMERWLAYFANRLTEREKEELAMQEIAISDAMQAARAFLSSTAERREYINREMARMDYESGIEDAKEEGREEGREEGQTKKQTELIRSMLEDGLLPEQVARIAKISVAEVKKIGEEP